MIKVAKIVEESYVDGPGRRTVVFLQGCPIHCEGCQNKALWNFNGGDWYSEENLADKLAWLAKEHGNITISGGEPFAQPKALAMLVLNLRLRHWKEIRNIIVYSGYTWDLLTDPMLSKALWVRSVLDHIDVLVDGKFMQERDDALITYRGSRNQRPIDVRASLCEHKIIELDWDLPEIVLTIGGNILMPAGLSEAMAEVGSIEDTRMCGQSLPY